jgi:hypothetical protein
MKTQHILLIVGVVVLAVLVARLQRPPVPQSVTPTSQSAAPGDQGPLTVQPQVGQEQGTPVADVAGSAAPGEAPAKPAITVRTDVRRLAGRQVSIGLVLAGPSGQTVPVTSIVRSPQPPGLRIVNEAGQVVGQGNFSYG